MGANEMQESIPQWRLCGGISTLESGFMFCELPGEGILLANQKGDVFCRFLAGQQAEPFPDCSGAELEAIEGFKALILKSEVYEGVK